MRPTQPDGADEIVADAAEYESLLTHLKRTRGFDFSGYKRAGLIRRIEKRMETVGVGHPSEYVDYLEVHPHEFGELFNTILINVTSFFRDPAAWQFLASEVLPRLLSGKDRRDPIRVWTAGCASGEETYTLAILLAEALGRDGFRDRVKIYATDIDDEALAQARQASYPARALANVPAPQMEKYFDADGDRFTVAKDIRRAVIFGRHDLMQDAPISRVDLLSCRNTLMYFNAEAQTRVLARLHFALNEGGVLFLGKAEMLFTHLNLFRPQDLKFRVFSKVPKIGIREQLRLIGPSGPAQAENQEFNEQARVREVLFETGPAPQIMVDASGCLSLANERARSLFRLGARDLGRPFQDLELSYRPAELRSLIERVRADRRPTSLREVPWLTPGGEASFVDIQVAPVQDDGAALLGTAITFHDVSGLKQLQDELQTTNRELETAYEELQSTNEELETTNEELQSTIEELETTNEELHSTNEELETINEELQSTNEELQAINGEARQRGADLDRVNEFFASVLTSLRAGVVVVDQNLTVQVWNRKSEDLWGLRAGEVEGRPLLLLDIGLPLDGLKQPMRDCLSGDSDVCEISLDARNRRGQDFVCQIICTPLINDEAQIRGVILLMTPTGQER